MRRWLIVVEDAHSEIDSEAAAAHYFTALLDDLAFGIKVERVQRGGLLANKIMGELPPVRHALMGRPRA